MAPKKEEKKKKEKSAKKSVDDILEDLNCGRDEEVKRLSSIIGRGKTNRGGIVVVTGTRRAPFNGTRWGPIRLRPLICTYAPRGARAGELTKSRKTRTRNHYRFR